MEDRLLDLSGLRCPLPALRTKRAVQTLAPGERLVVIATDPLASLDVPNAVREAGADLLDQSRRPDGSTVFRIGRRPQIAV